MTVSELKSSSAWRPACPRCGRPFDLLPRGHWIETGLGILALAIMTSLLVPLGFMAWKACTNLLSERDSHSILLRSLEDWTRH